MEQALRSFPLGFDICFIRKVLCGNCLGILFAGVGGTQF